MRHFVIYLYSTAHPTTPVGTDQSEVRVGIDRQSKRVDSDQPCVSIATRATHVSLLVAKRPSRSASTTDWLLSLPTNPPCRLSPRQGLGRPRRGLALSGTWFWLGFLGLAGRNGSWKLTGERPRRSPFILLLVAREMHVGTRRHEL